MESDSGDECAGDGDEEDRQQEEEERDQETLERKSAEIKVKEKKSSGVGGGLYENGGKGSGKSGGGVDCTGKGGGACDQWQSHTHKKKLHKMNTTDIKTNSNFNNSSPTEIPNMITRNTITITKAQ